MKLYCQYSGVSFHLPAFSSTLQPTVLTIHPAFHIEPRHLHKLYAAWQEGEMTDANDCKLLFLALLNHTGLIDWHTTAAPNNSTVQLHMSNLYATCKWVTAVHLPSMKLPRFAITKDTRDLVNIKYWMEIWEQIRTDFDAGYRTTTELEKQKQREELLEKLIKSDKESYKFAGILCQWGFAAADVPSNLHAYWRQIICTKGIDIFSLRKADIDEIVEHFEDALIDNSSIYSYTLLKHCRNLQKQVVTGLGYNITNSVDLVDVVTRGDFTIMDESDVTDTERLNVQKLINSAPTSPPIETHYISKVAFLRAKISYDMAQRAATATKGAQDRLEAELEAAFKADAVDGHEEDCSVDVTDSEGRLL